MSVSVGFAAHIDVFSSGSACILTRKWISPAYLPTGLQDLAGKDLYAPGWHFGFNIPAFLVVMVLTVILVRGIRESARTNNIMVLVKIVAILAFIIVGSQLHPPRLLPSLLAQRLDRHARRRLASSSSPTSDSIPSPPPAKNASNPQRDRAHRHHRHARRLHHPLRRRRRRASPASCRGSPSSGDGAPVVNALKRLSLEPGGHVCTGSASSCSSAPCSA